MFVLPEHSDQKSSREVRALLTAVSVGVVLLAGLGETNAETGSDAEDSAARKPSCPDHVPPEAREDVKQLTLLGVECFKTTKYDRAYTYYSRAFEVEESDLLVAALGRSLHELGIYHLARDHYRTFLERRDDGKRSDKIEKRLNQLTADVDSNGTEVKLESYPSDARVRVELANGEWVELGRTPTTAVLREGTYRMAFDRAQHRRETREVELGGDSSSSNVDVVLYHDRSTFDVTARKWKRIGLISGLSSIPVIGTGALFVGLANEKFNAAADVNPHSENSVEKEETLISQGYTFQQLGIGAFALGGVSLLGGTALFVRGLSLEPSPGKEEGGNSGDSSSDESASVSVRPVITPETVGIRGDF